MANADCGSEAGSDGTEAAEGALKMNADRRHIFGYSDEICNTKIDWVVGGRPQVPASRSKKRKKRPRIEVADEWLLKRVIRKTDETLHRRKVNETRQSIDEKDRRW